MINPDEAIIHFKRERPKLTVIRAAVYNKDLYIFEAVENPDEPDYNSPYYLMDNKTGEIAWFTPTIDLEAFHKAFRENLIEDGG